MFVLKSILRNWTIFDPKPVFCSSTQFCGKTTNSAARLQIQWARDNCGP